MISADAIRGYIDLIVLGLLRERPSYAYELAKTISQVSQGQYAIKQTTLYSALKRLEGQGVTESYQGVSESGKTRTYYRLSSTGQDYLDDKTAEWADTKDLVDRFVEGRE